MQPWQMVWCRVGCTSPPLLKAGTAARVGMRDPLCLFMVGTAGPPLGVGGTGCLPKGGSPLAIEPRGLTPSPPVGPSPQLASCASPGAKPKVVRDTVVRTPRPDSMPWARVGLQGVLAPRRCLPTSPTPWTLSPTMLAELQHRDTLCERFRWQVA